MIKCGDSYFVVHLYSLKVTAGEKTTEALGANKFRCVTYQTTSALCLTCPAWSFASFPPAKPHGLTVQSVF